MCFFLMIRRPPRSTPFPTRRSSDLRARPAAPDRARAAAVGAAGGAAPPAVGRRRRDRRRAGRRRDAGARRVGDRKSHTSELQSRQYLVCRLLLEKKKTPNYISSL